VPVYQYACTECGEQLEVRQSFTDSALTECPACEGRLRKVLNAVGVVFKGSGFYRTDSRAAEKSESGSAPAAAAAKDGAGSAAKGESNAPSTSDGSSKANGASKKESSSPAAGSSRSAASTPAAAR
jgi:putative FmdB family regulatory protein